MICEQEHCPICTSLIPRHCRSRSAGSARSAGGQATKIFRLYCPSCDTGFQHSYADVGLGADALVESVRLENGNPDLEALRRKHEEMSDRVVAAR